MILESEIDKWRKARGYTPAVGNEQLSEVQLLPTADIYRRGAKLTQTRNEPYGGMGGLVTWERRQFCSEVRKYRTEPKVQHDTT